jgi:hypothetical protein
MGSNLPPGVTAADVDRQFGGGHEHYFGAQSSTDGDRLADDQSATFASEHDREVFEDGAFIVIYRCHHAPVVDSWTDSARDETYTQHGSRCEAEKHVRLDASRVEATDRRGNEWHTVARSDGNVFHDAYDDDITFGYGIPRDLGLYVADALCDSGATVQRHSGGGVTVECDYHERVVTIDGTRYTELPERQIRVTYDNVSEDIRQ